MPARPSSTPLLSAHSKGLLAALLAAGMYAYAVQQIGACQASMMLALVPAFSAVGGALLLDESLGWISLAGIAVVSLGAVLGALPTRPSATPDLRKP